MHVDGGRGGGQLLRTALSVSACTGKPLTIANIRAKRPKPGLKPQHLACVHALSDVTDAKTEGAALGATALEFNPKKIEGGNFSWDIGTAGSAALLLQCVLPPLLLAERKSGISIRGGTDVPFAPPSLFMERVFPNALRRFGGKIEIKVARHGFYPKGGGMLEAKITPVGNLEAVEWLEKPDGTPPSATILAAGLPDHVAQREKKILENQIGSVAIQATEASCPGNVVFIQRDELNAFTALGKQGKKAEAVAQEALDAFTVFESGTDAVEAHVLDQMLLYAALAQGESRFRVSTLSEHAKTNLDALSTLLNTRHRFENGVLEVTGKP
ncbi:RNA 3'-phosphate cyclase [Candidatus Micrarchaeota archaeon]|nr:RNA 3'-phosphate cyclase [Candidatus Micrarchaeota archaeon]